jgi:hypothetical protein
MPLSNAERQRRYRARHLGRDLAHVTLDIGLGTETNSIVWPGTINAA